MTAARLTMSPETTNTSLSFCGPEMVGAILPEVTCDWTFLHDGILLLVQCEKLCD